jgi:transcriptional regulator with XRE-family HTH domain
MTYSHDNIAANLARIRTFRGLTPGALAELVGVSRQFIAKIESGARIPSASRICDLCSALGCDPADLLGECHAGPHVSLDDEGDR